MSWHCSISAIGANMKSSGKRKFFIPPPRKIIQVPWNSLEEMHRYLGFIVGEWKLSTNQQGHPQGLPHKIGVIVARYKSKALLWFPGTKSTMVINGTNFVGHLEEAE